jgi:hypothetical protein
MSINLGEKLLSLKQAACFFPRSDRRNVHYATLYRWALTGVRGVKLETIKVGGLLYTSTEAIERFVTAQTANNRADSPVATNPTQGQIQAEQALNRAGWQ